MSVGVDPTRAEVASELEALGDVSVAVRSSSVAEDLPDASFAGQYVSVLGARGIDAVMEAIARVRESATSLRARSYGGGQTAGMAVLVQRLIEGDASGVAFSANPSPETGQRSSSPPIRVRNRKLRRLLCVGSLLLIPPAIAACGGGGESRLALVGGTVVDPRTEQVTPNTTIVIVGDRITAVGSAGTTAVPPGAEVIDASGRWVLPGLMDLHAHPGAYEGEDLRQVLRTLLAFGITTIRSTHDPNGPELRARLQSGEIIGPRLWTSGPLIDGPGSPHPFAAIVGTEDEARDEVRRQIASGVDLIKLYANLDSALVSAVLAAAREAGVPTIGHLGRTGWMQAARMGIGAVTHTGVLGPTWELMPDSMQSRFRAVYGPGSALDDALYVAWVSTLPPADERIEDLTSTLLEHSVEVNPNLVLLWAITHGWDRSTWEALQTEYEPESHRSTPDGPPHPLAGPEIPSSC